MPGEGLETLTEALRVGHRGEPGATSTPGDSSWHPFDQVWSRLSDDRQSELESIVGLPITPRVGAAPDAVS